LKPLLAPAGAITKRKVDSDEQRDIEYGRKIAHTLASLDLGQSVAIADRDSDPTRRLPAAAGHGCHPCRAVALSRALTEAAQSRLTMISGSRDDVTWAA